MKSGSFFRRWLAAPPLPLPLQVQGQEQEQEQEQEQQEGQQWGVAEEEREKGGKVS